MVEGKGRGGGCDGEWLKEGEWGGGCDGEWLMEEEEETLIRENSG